MNTTTTILSANCRFHLGDIPDAWQAWYDDCEWQEVTLPHDWSVAQPFAKEYSSGTGYLAGGIGWYRLHIAPQKEWENRRVFLTFDGIYKNSRVWCNSYYLGGRPNGYLPQTYDITDFIRYDADIIVAVYVDHRDIADSRWFTGSGITRKVTLTVTDAVHLVQDGLNFTTPIVSEQEAVWNVTGEIRNTTATEAAVTLRHCLLDINGCNVSEATYDLVLAPGSLGIAKSSSSLSNPSLWSPDSPSLYTLQTYLIYNGEESLIDTRKIGIRSAVFDPDHGFFLNGQPTLLKGVCLHHDAGCLGAAVTPAIWRRRLSSLKKMGCNAIRTSHNPHMPELYDLCDSMGFLMIDEAFDEWEGPKNKWSTGHNVYPPKHQGYYIDFPQWHEQDLIDWIRRDRNHPSVLLWSIGNEIDYPNDPYCHPSFTTMIGNNDANKPAQERQYNAYRPNAERLGVLSRQLSTIVKDTDPTRPVTLAAAFPELSTTLGFIDPIDVVGYNYKEHLYEESHNRFPNKPFLGSENGHGYKAWRCVLDNEYISGQFLWTGIDYLGEAHGWPIHGSGAGIMTLAGFEKPSYYRRQSFWTSEPMVHLATTWKTDDVREYTPVSESWNYTPGQNVTVKCYTNQPSVTLYLNESEIGTYERDWNQDCISVIIPFVPGILRAVAGKAKHSLHTVGMTSHMQLHCWNDPDFASDPVYQIEVSMVDADGHLVPNDSSMLYVEVENGILKGLENGDLADITDYTASYRRAYHGRLLIYVVPGNGPVKVTVSSEFLPPASITL